MEIFAIIFMKLNVPYQAKLAKLCRVKVSNFVKSGEHSTQWMILLDVNFPRQSFAQQNNHYLCKWLVSLLSLLALQLKILLPLSGEIFGPRVYPMGSMVIALVSPLVRPSVSPSLNISENAHWFFLIFCMKLGHHKGTKVTEPDFWKIILGGHKWEKNPILGVYLMFFVHISASSH